MTCKLCNDAGEVYDDQLQDWVPWPNACGLRGQVNKAFVDVSQTPDVLAASKEAVDAYITQRMKEDGGFGRRIIPPVQIINDELDRQVDTDKPVKILPEARVM